MASTSAAAVLESTDLVFDVFSHSHPSEGKAIHGSYSLDSSGARDSISSADLVFDVPTHSHSSESKAIPTGPTRPCPLEDSHVVE